MPRRETAPRGAPCWVDLMTSDTEKARAFYGELFGWSAEEPNEEFGGYFNFSKDGVLVAGGMPRQPETDARMPDTWSVYLATDDANKTVEAAGGGGGKVIAPPMEVADLGTMAVITDPGNASIGIWQPGRHKGFSIVAEAGAPSWFELHTRDYVTVVDFYRDVFGWETRVESDTSEFRYTLMVDGGEPQAGIMDVSQFPTDALPTLWSVYFGADDTDATLSKAVELGASVVKPAEDTPYGRLAIAADPTGALFKLVAPNEATPAREP